MVRIYLIAAEQCLLGGNKESAMKFLSLALGHCNRDAMAKVMERPHVMRAMNYTRQT